MYVNKKIGIYFVFISVRVLNTQGEEFYMIIGLLICTIGIIPIFLALSVNKLYKGSNLSKPLLIYMILITIWQVDIGILYFRDELNDQVALMLFRLFRLSSTFAVPAVFFIAYVIIQNYSTTFKNENILNKILHFVFTKKMLVILITWSSFIYIVNWTKLGIEGLKVKKIYHASTELFFPEYGPLTWLYIFHMSSLLLFLIFVFLISRRILNPNMKKFLGTFSIYSFLLFITGFINFFPETGAIASSIGVIIFSVMIVLEFMKLNTTMTLHYYQLMERQKKLDYTGNLTGSLIHEVKNTNQIIKGFSQILQNSPSLTENEKEFLEMILKATEQIEDLSTNYREYIGNSKMEFKVEDLHEILEEAINFSKEMVKEKHVEIDFINHYRNVKAFVNRTYLQQVFINLIKNSVEAISIEREDRKITISIDLFENSIVINFQDTGRGISPENWESIFDPFMSFNNKGMGLGLPFVKKMIFEHRGDIQIINSTPSGTHFQIRIPQLDISDID